MKPLSPRLEGLFIALAECYPDTGEHVPKSLKQLFVCVKRNASERVMYRRVRILARDLENTLRAMDSVWCIANHNSGFVMSRRSRTPREILADVVKPTQKPKQKNWERKPRRKTTYRTEAKRTKWTARKPRIFLDPAQAPIRATTWKRAALKHNKTKKENGQTNDHHTSGAGSNS